MPASGTTFDIQYPETDPDLSSQTYSEGKLPAGKMKFTASDCTLDATANLTAAFSALRLNLYGIDRKVNSIVVTNTTSTEDPKPSYTLTCSTPVKVGNTEATAVPFLMVVPSVNNWIIQAEFDLSVVSPSEAAGLLVDYNDGTNYGKGTIVNCRIFRTSAAQTTTPGYVLDMPAKSLTNVWAPVNCGGSISSYGPYYQWGRKYGQTYEAGTLTPITFYKIQDTDANKGYFGYNSTNGNWFVDDIDNNLWNGSSKGASDPCPQNWRVPTYMELGSLTHLGIVTSGWDATYKGYWFDGTANPTIGQGVFICAGGYRTLDGVPSHRGEGNLWGGSYWSSSPNGNDAWYLSMDETRAVVCPNPRAYGFLIRCVQE